MLCSGGGGKGGEAGEERRGYGPRQANSGLASISSGLVLKDAGSEHEGGLNLRGVQKHTGIRAAPLFP